MNDLKIMWVDQSWSELDDDLLIFLCREITYSMGYIQLENLSELEVNYEKFTYKMLLNSEALDDPMFIYFRTSSINFKTQVETVKEWELTMALGGLGRFEPEMKVAQDMAKRNKESLRKSLESHLSIAVQKLLLKVYC